MDTEEKKEISEEKNPIDAAYLTRIEELEKLLSDTKKELDRANAAFKNLLENRNSESVANDEESDFLNNIKRLLKH